MKNIVVLVRRHSHKEDRSWCCNDQHEASRMIRWLKDNNIDAKSLNFNQWNKLDDYEG